MPHLGDIIEGMPSKAPPKTIGERLRQLREDRGLSRQQVHDALRDRGEEGVSLSTLTNWELGVAEPRALGVASLARYYGVSLDYLFLLSDEED